MTAPRLSPRQRGFALLIVLWTVSLLALIATQVTAAGHGETRLAANLRASAVAEQAADAGVFEAVFHLLDGSKNRWRADSITRRIKLPLAVVDVTIHDETRKLTLNNSSLPMLLGLLHAVGVEGSLATRLADEIADWRSPANFPLRNGAKGPQYKAAHREYGPPNQPYRSADELAMILHMTPEVLARLKPFLSPYVDSAPKAVGADPVIAAALADAQIAGAPALAFDEPVTVTILATATANGARFTRRAVIRLNNDLQPAANAPQYALLDWSTPEP